MVAVIKTGHSIHRIVNYNENKVKEGVAECIGAINYPADPEDMSINMKLKCFLKQLELNQNVKRNSVHISLNFHASESQFQAEKLLAIAENYMEKIGFGKQPYLVYRHDDAAHPHIHIVSVKVRADGSRIDMNNIGRNQSEQARKSIENAFGLVRAEEQKKQVYKLEAIGARRALYGKLETKRSIQNVLDHVIGQYKYTSLPELNAVLQQYNVVAERGSENSRVFQHKGLLYRVLDADGKSVGVPIKASAFYSKPTLKNLEAKFKKNEVTRMSHKARLKNAIELALLRKNGHTISQLSKALEKNGIIAVLRKNKEGLIYGITYVDHQTKCVFNGSALGKQYSAKAIAERCQNMVSPEQKAAFQRIENLNDLEQKSIQKVKALPTSMGDKKAEKVLPVYKSGGVLDELMQPEQTSEFMPYQLKSNRKKKKKKKGISNSNNF